MIRRLVDAHYDQHRDEPTDDRVRFWLRESRNPEVLIRVAAEHPQLLNQTMQVRPLLAETLSASRLALQQELEREQAAEMEADRHYWRPLVKELEALRLARRKRNEDWTFSSARRNGRGRGCPSDDDRWNGSRPVSSASPDA